MILRNDRRNLDEIRSASILPDYIMYPEGSVLIKMGNTQVICNVSIEESVPTWMKTQNKLGGWITAEYSMLPRATHTRSSRETFRPRGRTQEISRLIGRSLRSAVNLEKLDGLTCTLDCDVLQADGGTRTAAITGGYVALMIALCERIQSDMLQKDILNFQVAAISVALLNGIPILDLCYEEDSAAEVDLNVVFNEGGDFIEIQGTAEGNPFTRSELDKMLDMALKGGKKLLDLQRAVLGEKFPDLF